MSILPWLFFRSGSGMLVPHAGAANAGSFVGQPDAGAAAELGAVLVGLESDRADAVGGELLVAVLGVAGHADRADDLTGGVADLQPAALGKDLVAGRAQEIAHEDRLLLGAHLHQLGGAAHGERGIDLAVSHLEPDHGAAVLLLERLHLAAGLDHDHGQRPAIELGAALENGIDEAVGLIEGDGGHGSSGRWGAMGAETEYAGATVVPSLVDLISEAVRPLSPLVDTGRLIRGGTNDRILTPRHAGCRRRGRYGRGRNEHRDVRTGTAAVRADPGAARGSRAAVLPLPPR